MAQPLASPDDLGDFLGEDMGGARLIQAMTALELASGMIQSWTRQRLEQVVDDTITLVGPADWELILPERPVVEVTEVTINGMLLVPSWYRVESSSLIRLGGWWNGQRAGWWNGPPAAVTITYTHGYDPIPDDIRSVALQLAARTITNPVGISQETIGNYRVVYAGGGAAAAAAERTRDDNGLLLSTLSRYRVQASSVPVARDVPARYPGGYDYGDSTVGNW